MGKGDRTGPRVRAVRGSPAGQTVQPLSIRTLSRAIASFAYFRWCEDEAAVEESSVQRGMLRAIGEAMTRDVPDRHVKEFGLSSLMPTRTRPHSRDGSWSWTSSSQKRGQIPSSGWTD